MLYIEENLSDVELRQEKKIADTNTTVAKNLNETLSKMTEFERTLKDRLMKFEDEVLVKMNELQKHLENTLTEKFEQAIANNAKNLKQWAEKKIDDKAI